MTDSDDLIIRPATPDDVRQIAEVNVASWREAYTGIVSAEYLASLDPADRYERVAALLGDPDVTTWIATSDGTDVLGFATLGPARDEDAERGDLELYSIYLDPDAWGQGIARTLLRTVLAAAPQQVRLSLWVIEDNERARHFYRRNGLVPDGVERREPFGGIALTEVRYVRPTT